MIYPFVESMVANSIDDENRAKTMSILYVVVLGVSAPFGYIGGVLSSISARLPFVLMIATFLISLLLLAAIESVEKRKQPDASVAGTFQV